MTTIKEIQSMLKSTGYANRLKGIDLLMDSAELKLGLKKKILKHLVLNEKHPGVRYKSRKLLDDVEKEIAFEKTDEVKKPKKLESKPVTETDLFSIDENVGLIKTPEDTLKHGTSEEKIKYLLQVLNKEIQIPKFVLLECLENESDEFVIATLVKTIGFIGDRKCLDKLIPFLKHNDSRIRANTIEGLELLKDESIYKYIMPMMKDPDGRVRANAAKSLNKIGSNGVFKVLEEMVHSNQVNMIYSAIFSLRSIKHPKFEALLLEAIKTIDELKEYEKSTFISRIIKKGEMAKDKSVSFISKSRKKKEEKSSRHVKQNNKVRTKYLISTVAVIVILCAAIYVYFNRTSKFDNRKLVSTPKTSVSHVVKNDDLDTKPIKKLESALIHPVKQKQKSKKIPKILKANDDNGDSSLKLLKHFFVLKDLDQTKKYADQCLKNNISIPTEINRYINKPKLPLEDLPMYKRFYSKVKNIGINLASYNSTDLDEISQKLKIPESIDKVFYSPPLTLKKNSEKNYVYIPQTSISRLMSGFFIIVYKNSYDSFERSAGHSINDYFANSFGGESSDKSDKEAFLVIPDEILSKLELSINDTIEFIGIITESRSVQTVSGATKNVSVVQAILITKGDGLTINYETNIDLNKFDQISKEDIEETNSKGETILIKAVKANSLKKVKKLMALGADPLKEDKERYNSLEYCLKNENLEILKILAEKIKIPFYRPKTKDIICSLAQRGSIEILEYLLRDKKMPADYENSYGNHMIVELTEKGSLSVVELLLKYGANPFKKYQKDNSMFNTPRSAFSVARWKNPKIVQLIYKYYSEKATYIDKLKMIAAMYKDPSIKNTEDASSFISKFGDKIKIIRDNTDLKLLGDEDKEKIAYLLNAYAVSLTYLQRDLKLEKKFYLRAMFFYAYDAVIICNLADVYFWEKNYDKAIDLYTKALREKRGYQRAYKGRASAYYKSKKYQKCLCDIQEISDLMMTADLYYAKGKVMMALNHTSGLKQTFEKAVELAPNNKKYLQALNQVKYSKSRKSKYKSAKTEKKIQNIKMYKKKVNNIENAFKSKILKKFFSR